MVYSPHFRFSFVMIAVVLLPLLCTCGENDLSSEAISEALPDRLTRNLRFEKGEIVVGGPPPYHEGEEWPQVEFVDPPDFTLQTGESFMLDVKASYEFPDEIDGAMVWVKDALSHIDIRESVDKETLLLRLEAELLSDIGLRGKTFDLYISLYKGEETGLHETWRITIL